MRSLAIDFERALHQFSAQPKSEASPHLLRLKLQSPSTV
jgi:hypothetical protein